MRKPLFSLMAAATLLIAGGCSPLCRVETVAQQSAWETWFGPEPGIARTGFWPTRWRRMVDYTGSTVHVDPVDGEIMGGCQPCDPFRDRITGSFGKALEAAVKDRSKRLRLAPDRGSADYLMMVKVVFVREERAFFKLPIGFFPASDSFEFWLKLVDPKTQKIAFVYRSKGQSVESMEDLQNVARWVVADLDQFKKDHD
jgi:hypothetical protein